MKLINIFVSIAIIAIYCLLGCFQNKVLIIVLIFVWDEKEVLVEFRDIHYTSDHSG